MTPLSNVDWRDVALFDVSLLDACEGDPMPSGAVIESWFESDSDGRDRPLDALLTLYRQDRLSRDYRRRVDERLGRDPKFRTRLEHLERRFEERLKERRSLTPRERREMIRARVALHGIGVALPVLHGVSRRSGPPRRYARRHSRPMPLEAVDFVRQLADDLGLCSGIELVDHALLVVAATGEHDQWMREVRRARDRGVISSAVAYFLVRQFAESAIQRLSDTHPELSKLNPRIDRIERGRDADELLAWANYAGPPEWESLCEQWDATHDALLTLLLTRNEEYEVLHALLSEKEPFLEGRRQIYGL
ncbi:MAG: hypothetical protein ACJ796_17235 [Gemmatimonadaceae bacterium]